MEAVSYTHLLDQVPDIGAAFPDRLPHFAEVAKAFFFLGNTPLRDFREVGKAVRENCPYVRHLVQFTPDPQPGELLDGAMAITDLMSKRKLVGLKIKDIFMGGLKKAHAQIDPHTPALIIFTTGTTGCLLYTSRCV